MNILFDGRIFKYALDSYQARTGIYWVARNIFLELLQNKQIFTGHGNCYNDTPYHVMENLRYEQTD